MATKKDDPQLILKQMKELIAQGKAMVQDIRDSYNERIQKLNGQIQALEIERDEKVRELEKELGIAPEVKPATRRTSKKGDEAKRPRIHFTYGWWLAVKGQMSEDEFWALSPDEMKQLAKGSGLDKSAWKQLDKTSAGKVERKNFEAKFNAWLEKLGF